MGLTIATREPKSVHFEKLEIGDIFELKNSFYLKISENEAYSFTEKEYYQWFELSIVHPVDATLFINK